MAWAAVAPPPAAARTLDEGQVRPQHQIMGGHARQVGPQHDLPPVGSHHRIALQLLHHQREIEQHVMAVVAQFQRADVLADALGQPRHPLAICAGQGRGRATGFAIDAQLHE